MSKENTDNSWGIKNTNFKGIWCKISQCQHKSGFLWLKKPCVKTPHVIPCVAKLEPVPACDISQQLRFPHYRRKRPAVDKQVNSVEQTESHFWKYGQSIFPSSQMLGKDKVLPYPLVFPAIKENIEWNRGHYPLIYIVLSIVNLSNMQTTLFILAAVTFLIDSGNDLPHKFLPLLFKNLRFWSCCNCNVM